MKKTIFSILTLVIVPTIIFAQTVSVYYVGKAQFVSYNAAVNQSKDMFNYFGVDLPVVQHQSEQQHADGVVGAAPQFTAAAPTTLYGSGISSSATSITLTKLTTPNGYPIATADLVGGAGNVFYITLEPSTIRKESVSCTAVTQNANNSATLTGCTRGLLFTYPYTASTTLAISHSGGSAVVMSNSPQLYNDIITYVNNATVGGTVDASPTAKGTVEVATAAEAAAHAQNGSGDTTAYLVLTTNIASSTRTANTKQVVVASTTGYIDNSYIATSTLFSNINFTSTTTMATTTINTYNPYGLIGVTTATGNVTSMTVTGIPTRDFINIQVYASTTSSTPQPNVSVTFNGDSTSSYCFIWGTNVTPVCSTSLLPFSGATVQQLFFTMNLANPSSAFKLGNLKGFQLAGGGTNGGYSTSTQILYKSQNRISSVTVTADQASTITSGSYIRVYSDTSNP